MTRKTMIAIESTTMRMVNTMMGLTVGFVDIIMNRVKILTQKIIVVVKNIARGKSQNYFVNNSY